MSLEDCVQVVLRLGAAAAVGAALGVDDRQASQALRTLLPMFLTSAVSVAASLAALMEGGFKADANLSATAVADLFQAMALTSGLIAGGVAIVAKTSWSDRLALAGTIWISAMIGASIGLGAWIVGAVAGLLAFGLMAAQSLNKRDDG